MFIVSVFAEISKTLTNSPHPPGRAECSPGFPSWNPAWVRVYTPHLRSDKRESGVGCTAGSTVLLLGGEAKTLMACRQSTFRKRHLSAEYGYIVIYEQLLEGGYQVIVPALPGIVTYGRTLEEAREMAEDAIRCHLRALLKDGEDIPEDPFAFQQPISEELKVTV